MPDADPEMLPSAVATVSGVFISASRAASSNTMSGCGDDVGTKAEGKVFCACVHTYWSSHKGSEPRFSN